MVQSELLTAENLAAMRGERVLYKGLSFALMAGQIILLRGQNGSGKTTLLRQLAGLTQPTKGAIVRHVSTHWLAHDTGLKAHETPRQHLMHWARVWGSREDQTAILNYYGLKRAADVPARMLSAGQKRRTALARFRLEKRKLWLLDEPFTALDTAGRDLVTAEIVAQCARGGGAIVAAHGDFPLQATQEVAL